MTVDPISGLFNSKFIEAFLPYRRLPKALFHYTTLTSAELIKGNGNLWASRFDNSNDDFEFTHGLDLALRQFRLIRKRDQFSETLFENYVPFLNGERKNPSVFFMMSCFSLTKRSKYLWWNYASKNQGRCLEFNFSEQEIKNLGVVVHRPIFYSRIRFKKFTLKIFNEYTHFVRKNLVSWMQEGTYDLNMGHLMMSLHRDIFVLSSFCKRRKFRGEEEYRIAVWVRPSDARIKEISGKRIVEMAVANSIKNIHQY